MTNHNIAPVVAAPVDSSSRRGRIVGGAMLALGLTAGGYLAAEAVSNNNNTAATTATTVPGGFEVDNGCDVFVDNHAATVGNRYKSEAFLPEDEATLAMAYVDNLFGDNGPLSNKGDFDSLAAFMAVIANPANDGKAVNPNYNAGEAFADRVAQYQSAGIGAAREDCAVAYNTATHTAEYKKGWAKAGDTVTRYEAVRDEKNNIVGMKPVKVVLGEDLDGVEFALRDSSHEEDGFPPVLTDARGDMYVQGETTGIGVEVIANSSAEVSINPESPTTIETATTIDRSTTTEAVDPSTSSSSTSTSTSISNGGAATSTSVRPTGNQPAPTSTPDAPGQPATTEGTPTDVPGTTPGTTGTAPGTTEGGTGPTGTTPTATTTGNTAPGTTTPGTTAPNTTQPATTASETTQPVTTASNTTQPPTTPPPTTAPATTTPDKGPQPACVPNPPYVICTTSPTMAAKYGTING